MTSAAEKADRDRFVRRTLWVALALLSVAAALWLVFELSNVFFMVFVALFVAIALEPPVHVLEKRGWRRGVATGLVMLAAVLLGAGFLLALAPLFVSQVNQLVEALPMLFGDLAVFLNDTFGLDLSLVSAEQLGEEILKAFQDIGGAVVGGIIGITASVVGFLVFATTVALFAFYMIAELPQLQRTVLSAMPEDGQRRALRVWDVAVEKMGGYIYSRVLLAILSAVVTWAFLTLLDVRFAVSLAVWVGVLSQFVPVVGTYLASIFPTLVALTFNDLGTAVWVVVFFVGYQQIENYVFSPRITKRTMEIHPAVSVGAIIVGGTLMGSIGVILALPVAGIVQAIISEYRKTYEVILDDALGDPSPGSPAMSSD